MSPRIFRLLRAFLLILGLVTSPLICCGGIQLLDALPGSLLPSGLDFIVNLFESDVRIENGTSETFYVTAITTTYGHPQVIPQNISFRQRDIPLAPNSSVVLKYDSADMPLAGIAVCKTSDDCKLLPRENSGAYHLDSYETLPALESDWLTAIQSHPLYNYSNIVIPILSLLPVLLIVFWIYLGKMEKRNAVV